MSNEVKIVVSGQNKFGTTQKALIRQLSGITDASAGAHKEVDRFEAAFDRMTKRAKANADAIGGAARAQRAYASAVTATGRAFDRMGDDAEQGAKKAHGSVGEGVAEAATDAAQKAASGFMSAGLNAAKSLVGGITDGVSKAGPYVQGALVAVGATAAVGAGPMIGGALAGGIVTGFGAGIAGVGILAAAQTGRVQSSFANLWQFVVDGAKSAAQPLEQVLVNFAGRAKTILGGGLGASGRSFLGSIAPDLDAFGDSLLRAVAKFEPALEPLSRAFGRVLGDLGPTLERTLAGISDALIDVSESVAQNPEALGDFIEMTGDLVETGLDAVGMLNLWWDTNKRLVDIATTPFEWVGLKDGDEAATATKRALTAVAETSWEARGPAEQLEASWKALAEAGDDVAKRGSEITRVLQILSGQTPTFEEAQQQINDSIRGLIETFSDVTNHADGYGDALLKADGHVNTATANGSALYDTLTTLQGGFSNAAASVRELEGAGWSHDAAVQKVNDDMRVQYDRLIASAGQMGLTKQQMEALLAVYGLKPDFLDTMARLDENGVPQQVENLVRPRTLTITAHFKQFGNPFTDQDNARGTGTGWGVGGYATGGVSGGGWATVGELGPERVKLPAGAQVMPHTQSGSLLAAQGGGGTSGGGAITLDFTGLPPAGTGRMFLDWFFDECRKQGVRLVTA